MVPDNGSRQRNKADLKENDMIDVEKALLDPAAIFKHPQQVIDTNDLSRDQKIEVLRRWEYDVREIQVLDDESTTAKETHAVTLDSVLNALRSLGAPIDVEHTAPTKQGGS
jgi:hypothetical protein